LVSNVQALNVNLGPESNYANGIFTSVTVCIHGTSTCQTIDDVLVDTGSYGLRLLGSALSIALPQQTSGAGNIGECTVFADGFTWGPVVTADIQLAGETAANVPVQVIGSYSALPSFPSPPGDCSQGNGQEEDTLATVGTNGILGIGNFAQDCGPACVTNSTEDVYFACNGSSCVSVSQSLANQVQNPVSLFAGDNNGVQIQLPAIGANGATTVSGSLIFGIGTQPNNGLGSAKILTTDDAGNVKTSFNGSSFTMSFVDSGSNGLYFPDPAPASSNFITQCSGNNAGFYCPASTLNLSATMSGQNGTSVPVSFSVANADTLFAGNNAAFNNLAGTDGSGLNGAFDWGLPFFYGRNVYFAIQSASTPGGAGPYVAY
jgi:hypothetical protein